MKDEKKQQTILQCFEWYLPDDASFWKQIASEAKKLSDIGITDVWLPPAYKGSDGIHDVGYGVYDMYDLGEFPQKDTIPTKYGTKKEYLAAIAAFHKTNIQVFADIVLNHRMGADETEEVTAVQYSPDVRDQQLSEPYQISAWTKFNFPERKNKYSDFTWNWTHFHGVDWDNNEKRNGLFLFQGKEWAQNVDIEHRNFDYLMGADLDMNNPEVLEELDKWGKWYLETTGVDGFRLDAVKHINFPFYTHWLTKLRNETGLPLPSIAEYWNSDLSALHYYLDRTGHVTSLFDVPLHFKFYQASNSNGTQDMRQIFDGTLVNTRPDYAITFVDNHDTQPEQALQSFVEFWFKPLAYAMILLREHGTPCVFYGDLYGIPHNNIPPVNGLDILIKARKQLAYGPQTDYLNHPDIIGWTRGGDEEAAPHSGLAVLLSDGPGGSKFMCVGVSHAGETFVDCLGNCEDQIVLDEAGCAEFRVNGGSVSVWVSTKALPL